MNILVTGGAGYIGRHLNRLLIEAGHKVIVFDNLATGDPSTVIGPLVVGDLLTPGDLHKLNSFKIDAVFHLAGLADARESMEKPLEYMQVNHQGTLNLLEWMRQRGIKYFIASSSCSVYGSTAGAVDEETRHDPASIYGYSKMVMEHEIEAVLRQNDTRYVLLRYFNAAGAHPNGKLGERPDVSRVITLMMQRYFDGGVFTVFGDDFDTPDGTAVRDYAHVLDIGAAHIHALNHMLDGGESNIFNVGTGDGVSILDIIKLGNQITGIELNYRIGPRKDGDPALVYAKNEKITSVTGWEPSYSLGDILRTAWVWELTRHGELDDSNVFSWTADQLTRAVS